MIASPAVRGCGPTQGSPQLEEEAGSRLATPTWKSRSILVLAAVTTSSFLVLSLLSAYLQPLPRGHRIFRSLRLEAYCLAGGFAMIEQGCNVLSESLILAGYIAGPNAFNLEPSVIEEAVRGGGPQILTPRCCDLWYIWFQAKCQCDASITRYQTGGVNLYTEFIGAKFITYECNFNDTCSLAEWKALQYVHLPTPAPSASSPSLPPARAPS